MVTTHDCARTSAANGPRAPHQLLAHQLRAHHQLLLCPRSSRVLRNVQAALLAKHGSEVRGEAESTCCSWASVARRTLKPKDPPTQQLYCPTPSLYPSPQPLFTVVRSSTWTPSTATTRHPPPRPAAHHPLTFAGNCETITADRARREKQLFSSEHVISRSFGDASGVSCLCLSFVH